MLKYQSIRPFNSWYDAGMNFAQFVVKVWVNSKHFTLSDYDGKDEFYDMASDIIERIDCELQSISPTDTSELLQFFKQSVQQSTLTFRKLLYVTCNLLYMIDLANGVHSEAEDLEFTLGRLSGISNQYDVEGQSYQEQSEVPFITPTGIFGMNTYLYLLYHGLHPVACSLTPITADGTYDTGYSVMYHDLQHKNTVDTLTPCRYQAFRKIYSHHYADQDRRLIVLVLFVCIHEYSSDSRVPLPGDDIEEYYDLLLTKEYIQLLLKLDRYRHIIPIYRYPSHINWSIIDNDEEIFKIAITDAVTIYQHVF